VLVDGYNVAKLAWPDEELIVQRDRLLDAVDTVARRFNSEITVVFDGADVVGSHARRRHLARVVYSPVGVSADDVIRAEVTATPPDRPVVVVTNDQAVRRDVAAAGANVVASESFAAAAR
jgi:predicted RNA-binding protein with PIN domain